MSQNKTSQKICEEIKASLIEMEKEKGIPAKEAFAKLQEKYLKTK